MQTNKAKTRAIYTRRGVATSVDAIHNIAKRKIDNGRELNTTKHNPQEGLAMNSRKNQWSQFTVWRGCDRWGRPHCKKGQQIRVFALLVPSRTGRWTFQPSSKSTKNITLWMFGVGVLEEQSTLDNDRELNTKGLQGLKGANAQRQNGFTLTHVLTTRCVFEGFLSCTSPIDALVTTELIRTELVRLSSSD
jgi:hypothetical protein